MVHFTASRSGLVAAIAMGLMIAASASAFAQTKIFPAGTDCMLLTSDNDRVACQKQTSGQPTLNQQPSSQSISGAGTGASTSGRIDCDALANDDDRVACQSQTSAQPSVGENPQVQTPQGQMPQGVTTGPAGGNAGTGASIPAINSPGSGLGGTTGGIGGGTSSGSGAGGMSGN